MKNLMIFIGAKKDFIGNWSNESEILVKVQIDNSLEMGWKKEDIILVTNFDYEYEGVKSLVIGDENYCPFSDGSPSKINAILTLFEKGLIVDDIYWFHDFDTFQLDDVSLELDLDKIAITDYGITNISKGFNGRWSTGSLFFRNGSRDVFEWIKATVYKHKVNEEVSLLALTRHNSYGILDRIKKLNITYNFATRRRNVVAQYEVADKPLKVIHFHPFDKRPLFYLYKGNNNMDVCVYGKSPLNKPLVTERLIRILSKHGIT